MGSETLAWPVDGDEPYYVLVAESILGDGDLDLRNQYEATAGGTRVTGRRDLGPHRHPQPCPRPTCVGGLDRDRPGFWETYGYHIYGDPWREERYS